MHASYDHNYFDTSAGGEEVADVYRESNGLARTRYTDLPLAIEVLEPGDRILDVGCGRGEMVFQTAAMGAISTGIDFSEHAIEMAMETRGRHSREIKERTCFMVADAKDLPFPDGTFDKIYMLDIVEHVSKEELHICLTETRRVLSKEGRLIVHTTQNLWTRKYGYWLECLVSLVQSGKMPTHPIVAWYRSLEGHPKINPESILQHINEQSILSLKLAMRRSGYKSVVWVADPRNPFIGRRDLLGRMLSGLYRLLGVKYIHGDDICAVGSSSRSGLPHRRPLALSRRLPSRGAERGNP